MKKIVIAIDGFSSCGKSTMAKDLASEIGYIYIDSGAMYRAVTLFAIQHNLFREDGSILETELKRLLPTVSISFSYNNQTRSADTYLNGEKVETLIRTLEISSQVSNIAALPFVRTILVELQQKLGNGKGLVMDGRDIGTTVFPDAELKIYVTASAEIRAQRRFKELQSKGIDEPFENILENVKKRDYIDMHREVSPLQKAKDAIELDNSEMTTTQQKKWLMAQFRRVVSE
jgi:CMP/dCMP kinase